MRDRVKRWLRAWGVSLLAGATGFGAVMLAPGVIRGCRAAMERAAAERRAREETAEQALREVPRGTRVAMPDGRPGKIVGHDGRAAYRVAPTHRKVTTTLVPVVGPKGGVTLSSRTTVESDHYYSLSSLRLEGGAQ